LGEECVESALAAVDEDDEWLAEQAADLNYNLLVLLEKHGIPNNKVDEVLQKRTREKARVHVFYRSLYDRMNRITQSNESLDQQFVSNKRPLNKN
jgi:hypothetical protein